MQITPQTQKKYLLELINEFSKVTGYKINTQKSLEFLHTNNEKSEREIEETISFTIATKRKKYLKINLPKETKDLYADNCKPLMNNTNRWRDMPCSWIGKNQYYQNDYTTPKQSTDSMQSLSNYQWHFSQN